MLHPNTQVRWKNDLIGYGIFAAGFIPMGTITYVQDKLDIVIPTNSQLRYQTAYAANIKRYTARDTDGNWVLCWDNAKYINHCCHPNTLGTGYHFDIAIYDIQTGDELLCDYALLNLEEEMDLICTFGDCRKKMCPQDFDVHTQEWDSAIRSALPRIFNVEQPLLELVDPQTRSDLAEYLHTGIGYKSVKSLKYQSF